MVLPCIVIQRHKTQLYEWSILFGQDKIHGDVGDSSVTDCLSTAASALPQSISLAEINYGGFHMGTFHISEIIKTPFLVADRIVASFGNCAPMAAGTRPK